jgi:hypothetical protein
MGLLKPPAADSQSAPATAICAGQGHLRKRSSQAQRWRVSFLRSRAQNLGTIEAPDAKAAEDFAVKLFGLSEEQRKRLAIWELSVGRERFGWDRIWRLLSRGALTLLRRDHMRRYRDRSHFRAVHGDPL